MKSRKEITDDLIYTMGKLTRETLFISRESFIVNEVFTDENQTLLDSLLEIEQCVRELYHLDIVIDEWKNKQRKKRG